MEKVYHIIQTNSKKTGNASGIPLITAWDESKMNLQEFVLYLDQLIKDQKVYMRDGINHSLLFAI